MKITFGKILLFGALIGGGIYAAKKILGGGSVYVPLDYKSDSLGKGILKTSAGLNKVADKLKDFTGWKQFGMSENTGNSFDEAFYNYPLYASMVNGKLYMEMPKSYVDTMIAEDRQYYSNINNASNDTTTSKGKTLKEKVKELITATRN